MEPYFGLFLETLVNFPHHVAQNDFFASVGINAHGVGIDASFFTETVPDSVVKVDPFLFEPIALFFRNTCESDFHRKI